jgi:hypothetical protein
MRLLTLLFTTFLIVVFMAWYLVKTFAPGTNSPVSTHKSTEVQLEEIQKETDLYQNTLNRFQNPTPKDAGAN